MGRAMKDSGVEWIGKIPEDWKIHKIKNHFRIISGSGFKPDLQGKQDGDYPVCKASDISSAGSLLFSASNYITKEIARENGFSVIPKNSILFPKIGEAMRKNSRTLCMVDCCADNNCQGLVPQDMVSKFSYFLFFCIDMTWFDNASTIPCINNQKLYECLIPCPEIDEQQRIATFLTSQCAEIDAVISQTRASIEEYKRLKQAVITQAVTKGVRGERAMKDSAYSWIGLYPTDWKEIKIKWLLSERKERSAEGLEEPLSMSQKYGLIPTKEMDMIPNMASSFVGAKRVYCGDLVFNKLKAHLGVFSVSSFEGLVSPDYAVYYSTGLADMKFLEYLFKTPQYIAEFRKKSSGVGAGLTRLYTADLYSIYCALPPLDEQNEIVSYLREKCTEIDALIAKKEQLLTELDNYKKSLIYEYVTGKKEVLI